MLPGVGFRAARRDFTGFFDSWVARESASRALPKPEARRTAHSQTENTVQQPGAIRGCDAGDMVAGCQAEIHRLTIAIAGANSPRLAEKNLG